MGKTSRIIKKKTGTKPLWKKKIQLLSTPPSLKHYTLSFRFEMWPGLFLVGNCDLWTQEKTFNTRRTAAIFGFNSHRCAIVGP